MSTIETKSTGLPATVSGSFYTILSTIHENEGTRNPLICALYYADTTCAEITALHVSLKDGDVVCSYLPMKVLQNQSGFVECFSHPQRQTGRLGRALRKVLPEKTAISESDFKRGVELIAAEVMGSIIDIELLPASEIPDIYCTEENPERFLQPMGAMGSSCMRYKSKKRFMEYYGFVAESNPESLQILVAKKRGKIAGRALLWQVVMPDGTIGLYMDRRYTSGPTIDERFLDWARNNNVKFWWTAARGSSKTAPKFGGPYANVVPASVKTVASMDLDKWAGSTMQYPYIDTMSFVSLEDGTLRIVPPTNMISQGPHIALLGYLGADQNGMMRIMHAHVPRGQIIDQSQWEV